MKPNKTQQQAFDAIIPYINAANIDYGVSTWDADYYIRRRERSNVYNLLIRPDGTFYFIHQKHGAKVSEREFGTDGAHCARYFLDPNDTGAKE